MSHADVSFPYPLFVQDGNSQIRNATRIFRSSPRAVPLVTLQHDPGGGPQPDLPHGTPGAFPPGAQTRSPRVEMADGALEMRVLEPHGGRPRDKPL